MNLRRKSKREKKEEKRGCAMQQDPLSLGLEIVKKAVADDIAQNFASAIRNYDLAVGYLTQALQDPKNAANQVLISIKIREYTERRVS